MTGATMLVAVLLLAAAVLVAWPVRSIRARRRRVLTPGRRRGGVDPDDALVQWIRELGRTPDGTVDGTGAAPTSGHPVGIAYEPGTTAGSSGRQTALGWPDRDVTRGPRWPRTAGGSTRPEGPTRPPARRDLRRPTGTARPEEATTMLDAEQWPGASAATITIGVSGVDVGGRHDVSDTATADGHGDPEAGPRGDAFAATAPDGYATADSGDPGASARPTERRLRLLRYASHDRRPVCCHWSVCSAAVWVPWSAARWPRSRWPGTARWPCAPCCVGG